MVKEYNSWFLFQVAWFIGMNDTNEKSFDNTSFSGLNVVEPSWLIVIPETQRIAFYVSFSLVLLLSLIGNTYIIAIVLRNKQMHSTINYLIVNMAMADLAGSVASILVTLSRLHNLSFEWKVTGTLGTIFCKVYPFLVEVSLAVSILSMIVIALERFFAIVYPMKLTPRFLKNRITLPAIWLTAIATFTFDLFSFQLAVIPIADVHLCIRKWPKTVEPIKADAILCLFFAISYFIAPFVFIVFLYLSIVHKLKRQKLLGHHPTEFENERRKENAAIIKMVFTIMTCFLVCWLPFLMLWILWLFVWKGAIPQKKEQYFQLIFSVELFSRVCFFTNPMICFIFISSYRRYLQKIFPFNLFSSNRFLPSTEKERRSDLISMHLIMRQQRS